MDGRNPGPIPSLMAALVLLGIAAPAAVHADSGAPNDPPASKSAAVSPPKAEKPGASDTPTKSSDEQSLDERLLDDLDNDLLDGLDAIPARAESGSEHRREAPASELDRQLLRQLGQGEDLGQEASDPLISIGHQMRAVETLISQSNTSERTQQLQKEIVEALERLIKQAQQQCAGGQCAASCTSGSSKRSASKAGAGENRGGTRPAKDSTASTAPAKQTGARLEQMKGMLKEVWGHLPPKVRDQIQNSAPEEFLPKYEKLIEEYYKRLAEEQSRL